MIYVFYGLAAIVPLLPVGVLYVWILSNGRKQARKETEAKWS